MFISVLTTLSQGGVGVFVTGLALVFMLMGLIRGQNVWMILAAIFTFPYTFMTGSWSGILLLVRLLPLTQLASAYFIEKEDSMLAWILAVPTLAALGYSFYDILVRQPAFQLIVN